MNQRVSVAGIGPLRLNPSEVIGQCFGQIALHFVNLKSTFIIVIGAGVAGDFGNPQILTVLFYIA